MSTPMTNSRQPGVSTTAHRPERLAQYVSFSRTPSALIARAVTPAIGQREAPIVETEILDALADSPQGCKWLVMDFSAVSVLSSMGLGMCVELRRHAKERKMRTALFGLNGHLRDLFRMMKVDRLYKIVHSKDDLRKLTN
ncbi:MAG: STAS domain-containing protein [Planctomycetota bacterium]|nr:STAS domain-containing protein [Planctomycetota bacterium]